jgi:hypothetical protein
MLAALTVIAASAGLAACGSSSSPSSSANARFQARLKLAECFRAHGVNVPDPSPTGEGGPSSPGGSPVFKALQNYSRTQVLSAFGACRAEAVQAFPALSLSPAQRAQRQQQLVKFAQCLRSHGLNVPDPTVNGGGGFGFAQGFRSLDLNSPAFKSALAACQSLRPRFGRRFGGPGG